MGMYDRVRSAYPLQDEIPPWATEFQTKDFYQELRLYEITEEGRLLLNSIAQPYTGALTIYTNNVACFGPGGIYVRDGTGPNRHSIEIVFLFDNGIVVNAVCTQMIAPCQGEMKDFGSQRPGNEGT